jgi:gliding motility-associated-like protein
VASGPVTVYVTAPISIPSAFSPNGDGKNDVFYVLGGPVGLVIREFTVFNRWGQLVFQAHDAPAGNPSFGWNGQDHGSAVPADAYVYIIAVRLPSGTEQLFKGTVLVVR